MAQQRYCFIYNRAKFDELKDHYKRLPLRKLNSDDAEMLCFCLKEDSSVVDIRDFVFRNKQLKGKGLAHSNAIYTPLWSDMLFNNGPFIEGDHTVKAQLKTKTGYDVSLDREFLYIALKLYNEKSTDESYHKNFETAFNSYSKVKFRDLDSGAFKNSTVDKSSLSDYSTVRIKLENGDELSVELENYETPSTIVTRAGDIIPALTREYVIINANNNNGNLVNENKPGSCWSAKWVDPITKKVDYCLLKFKDPMENVTKIIDDYQYVECESSMLSNCYRSEIVGDVNDIINNGITFYASVEHAYQSLRFDESDREKFKTGGLLSPIDDNDHFIGLKARDAYAKRSQYGLTPLVDVGTDIWDKLEYFMRIKFESKQLQQALLETGNKYLAYKSQFTERELHDNPKLDELGCIINDDKLLIGNNRAGRILMKIRKELKEAKARKQQSRIDNIDIDDDDNTDDSDSTISDDDDDDNDGEGEEEDNEILNFDDEEADENVGRTNRSSRSPERTTTVDDEPDYKSLDANEELYINMGNVLTKTQQMRIIRDGLISKDFSQFVKVNNSVIKRVADDMFALIGKDNYENYIKTTTNYSIIAFLKYAEQRESFILEDTDINE